MATDPTADSTPTQQELQRMALEVHRCQRFLHLLTGVMIGAFLLILLMTTFSTGAFVQVVGRGLYFVILAAAVVSVGLWLRRVLLEKRAGVDPDILRSLIPPL